MSGGDAIVFVVRVRTRCNVPVANSKGAAMAIRRGHRIERDTARLEATAALRRARRHPADLLPALVTVTRCSPGRLDQHDGPQHALKHVIDGIALALGVNDGGPAVRWEYGQKRSKPGVHGVIVRIERDTDVATKGRLTS